MRKAVLVTGGFDPLHSGHIEYFKAARKLGDCLIVGINSDDWLIRKKGRPFMPFKERASIIKELACVDEVIAFNDNDDSANCAIMLVLSTKSTRWKLVFANGGDRTNTTTPEYKMYGDHPSVEFAFGVGGTIKKNSSSWILKNWEKSISDIYWPTVERAWGSYTVLDSSSNWLTKNLTINQGASLSDQKHQHRSEHWHIVSGMLHVSLQYPDGEIRNQLFYSGESFDIPANTWHKVHNAGETVANVVEVWLGNILTEDDIERRD